MLIQRSSVVLPEPLGPITTTTSPELTESEMLRSTSRAPKRLETPSMASIGRRPEAACCSMTLEDTSLEMSTIQRQCVADAEIDDRRADEDLERRQCSLDDLAACHCQLPKPDDGNQ
jgi:hypothetical protein